MPKTGISKNCQDQTSACHKCGRTWYVKGNNVNIIRKRLRMLHRLHDKKCKGTKNLSSDEVHKLVSEEAKRHSAPLAGAFVITGERLRSMDTTNTVAPGQLLPGLTEAVSL